MSNEANKIVVKNVYKIFGNRATEALNMVRQNQSKDQVLAQTGCVVGVNDLSLSLPSSLSVSVTSMITSGSLLATNFMSSVLGWSTPAWSC